VTTTLEPRAATTLAVPPGRGRWRVTLHNRQFANASYNQTMIAELPDVRSKKLTRAWLKPAEFTFTLDGDLPEAALIRELYTDVVAWRWDEYGLDTNIMTGTGDTVMFRGLIDHAEDQISEDTAVVNFTAHDYSAMLSRRYLTSTTTQITQTADQDTLAANLLGFATTAAASGATSFYPASYLPLSQTLVNPDGSIRSLSGTVRTRAWAPGTNLGTELNNLALVQGGFDYDVTYHTTSNWPYDLLNLYYPAQGVTRSDLALIYGANVASLTRTVASDTYANMERAIGNNQNALATAAQYCSDYWNSTANDITQGIGLFAQVNNLADVTVQSTLDAAAYGDINIAGLLVPTYSVTMRTNAYRYRYPNLGDTVPLIVQRGRLNVNSTPATDGGVRVLGIDWTVGDDDTEVVGLTLGRPVFTLYDEFRNNRAAIQALTRR
jgi:hypothetical protein